MSHDMMMAIAILLPVVAAILVYLIPDYRTRGGLVILTAVILILNSLAQLRQGPFNYTPAGTGWGEAIKWIDFLMLFFFIYAAVARRSLLILIFTLTQLFPLLYWEFVLRAHVEVEPAFMVDHLSIVMTLIISIIGSLICVFGVKYITDHEHHLNRQKSRQSTFHFWMIIFLGAMNGLVFANNLYWLYFFWEVTTLCSYMLIGHDLTKEALANATRAYWMNSIGGTTFVFAIIYLYANGGSEALSLQKLIAGGHSAEIILLPLALLCFTGFTKAAQMPFQSWLLGAMVAPTPVSALLHSSTMVKAGVYLVVRLAPAFSPSNLGQLGTLFGELVALCGSFTFLGASLLAISQTTGKRVLAYSTIANLGLIIACAGINTPLSIAAAILLIIFHAISKAMLFLSAGTIEHIIWSREIDDMEALAEKAPLTTLITGIGILSMFLPPFGMLLSKWMAIEAATSVSNAAMSNRFLAPFLIAMLVIIAGLFVVASAATVVFWSKWLGRLLEVVPRIERRYEKVSPGYFVPLWILLVGIFAFGLLISPVYHNFVQLAVNNASQGIANVSSQVLTDGGFVTIESVRSFPGAPYSAGIMPLGFYPVWILFVLLAMALAVPFFIVSVKQKELRPVYLCGENCGDVDTECYMTAAEQKTKMTIGGLYLQKLFGEAALNPTMNLIAISLLIIFIGIILGVTLR